MTSHQMSLRATQKAPASPASPALSAGAGPGSGCAEDSPAGEDALFDRAVQALVFGFLPWLQEAFPERWGGDEIDGEIPVEELLQDITFVSGLSFERMCGELPASYAARKAAYDEFAAEHGLALDCVCFHGSTRGAVRAIHEEGFDAARLRGFAFGKGAYVSQLLAVALSYATRDEDGLLWATYGRARLGDPYDTPVGSKGQTDFGVGADGRPRVTLTNPTRTYWCLKDPARQFLGVGYLAFSIRTDTRPSDFALCNMLYPQEVWADMKKNIPGLVPYKQRLLARRQRERRKAQASAAWTAALGRRVQPPRRAKRQRGA